VIDFHDFDSGQCWFDLQLIPETISKTSFSTSNIGDIVNLEKAIILGQRLDGHLVQGHIDGVGVISSYIVENDSWVIAVNIPKDLQKYISYKGSITINGVSLTISQKTPLGLEVSLIKHTIEKTNLGTLTVGSIVNIEIDVIARYVENLLQNKFNN
jgi:riboflavin synthase